MWGNPESFAERVNVGRTGHRRWWRIGIQLLPLSPN